MERAIVKRFVRWLEQASAREILERRAAFLAARSRVSSREGRADLRRGLRLIDEELAARRELARARGWPASGAPPAAGVAFARTPPARGVTALRAR